MKVSCGFLESKWTTVFACSSINFLTNGISRMLPLFYVASIERYHVNREQASFPYVLRYQTEFIAGPFIGYLGCKYDPFLVTLLGCVLASIGIGACFFAESISVVIFCYGILFGIGCAMARQLLAVTISNRFQQNLSLANGIFLTGASLGSILFSPLFEYFLEKYNLSGTFLLSSALLLQAMPAAMLLKTPKSPPRTANTGAENTEHNMIKVQCSTHEEPNNGKCYNDATVFGHATHSSQNMKILPTQNTPQQDENFPNPSFTIVSITPTHTGKVLKKKIKESGMESKEESKKLAANRENSKVSNLLVENPIGVDKNPCDSSNYLSESTYQKYIETNSNSLCLENISNKNFDERNGNGKHCAIRGKTSYSGRSVSIVKIFSIFWDPLFVFMSINNSLYFFSLIIFMTVVVDFSRDLNIPAHEEVYILICFSVSDVFGRFGLSWIPDKGFMDINNFSALCFIAFSASLMALSFSKSFTAVMISVSCSMLLLGVQRTMITGVVSKFFQGDKKTTALSSSFLLYAPLSYATSPMIGFFRTQMGSYVGLFWAVSALNIYCAFIQYFLPNFKKCRRKDTDETERCQEIS